MPQKLSPRIVPGGKGELVAVVGDAYRVLARGEDTGGVYGMIEGWIPPKSSGPPPHTHTREDETFFILEGEITVTIDGKDTVAAVGSYAFFPRDIRHKFRNDSNRPARMLITITPAGFEKFFTETGEVVSDPGQLTPPTPEHIQKVVQTAPRYGVVIHAP